MHEYAIKTAYVALFAIIISYYLLNIKICYNSYMAQCENITPSRFWNNVDNYRKQANISWHKMAYTINIDPANLSNTRKSIPRLSTALNIANTLGCTIDDLIQG